MEQILHEPCLPDEAWNIPSIEERLTFEEQTIRMHLLDLMLEHRRPVSLPELKKSVRTALPEPDQAIDGMVAKRLAGLNSEGNFAFSYPVSTLSTDHLVTLANGQSFHAMCAVDAIGALFTFRQNILIRSRCHQCGSAFAIKIEENCFTSLDPPTLQVVHADLRDQESWAVSC